MHDCNCSGRSSQLAFNNSNCSTSNNTNNNNDYTYIIWCIASIVYTITHNL